MHCNYNSAKTSISCRIRIKCIKHVLYVANGNKSFYLHMSLINKVVIISLFTCFRMLRPVTILAVTTHIHIQDIQMIGLTGNILFIIQYGLQLHAQ